MNVSSNECIIGFQTWYCEKSEPSSRRLFLLLVVLYFVICKKNIILEDNSESSNLYLFSFDVFIILLSLVVIYFCVFYPLYGDMAMVSSPQDKPLDTTRIISFYGIL